MKILQYCQHVLGIGHFFRTIEILKALHEHEIILVTGGTGVDVDLPAHVQTLRLPELMMDAEFKALSTCNHKNSLEEIKTVRGRMLNDVFAENAPDVFILELYPFGRRSFAFEIDPVLTGIRKGRLPSAAVVCSLRDILVEREKALKYESGVLDKLNTCFDLLLIHSDPTLFKLEESFSRTDDIAIPVTYTGFVAQRPAASARKAIRDRLGIGKDELLVLASAGSGAVGAPLLEAARAAFKLFQAEAGGRLLLFGGPLLPVEDYLKLSQANDSHTTVIRFSQDFLSCLAAADLSVSMGGYNTCMNILATEVPALVWPFAQNREQRYRAERLASIGAMQVLVDGDLKPQRLADCMRRAISRGYRLARPVDLNGAAQTAKALMQRFQKK